MSDQDISLLDLFREEARGQTATLSQGLIDLEGDAGNPRKIEPLMRAAHSLKGAARIVGIDAAVRVAHVMEDALVAAQNGKILLSSADIDVLLRGSDLLALLADVQETRLDAWGLTHQVEIDALVGQFMAMAQGVAPPATPAAIAPLARLSPGGVQSVIPREPVHFEEDDPLFALFREELRQNALALREGLQGAFEQPEMLDDLARAAHSIKGAAQIVAVKPVARLAGAIENTLGMLRQAGKVPGEASLELLRRAVDLAAGVLPLSAAQVQEWCQERAGDADQLCAEIQNLQQGESRAVVIAMVEPAASPVMVSSAAVGEPAARGLPGPVEPEPDRPAEPAEAVVRVTAQSLNRLMSLAGESLVQARWLQPFSTALLKLKKHQDHLASLVDRMADAVGSGGLNGLDPALGLLEELRRQAARCRQVLAERIGEFEDHAAAAEDLNTRLYREVIVSRMRPFADGTHSFPRLVRDMARKLDKQVRLEIEGQSTEVDRDILEKLESPLMHLLRNAIDHGIEPARTRAARGKPEQGVVRLEARHRAGMLAITVSDDGAGIDLDRLRKKIVERGMNTAEMASSMTEAELLEFLFLPGFSTARELTEYSGRGVGLDVVQDTIRKIGGSVRITTRPGKGTAFHLQLPITLSVLRAVLVDIAGEPYAFPHNRIDRLLRVPRDTLRSLEHRQYVAVDGQNVGLVVAAQLLEMPGEDGSHVGDLPVLLMSDDTGSYGLIVEAFRGEQDLVVRPLDPRLGKVPNVAAAAILDDGKPVLIADVEDLIRSMDHFIQSGTLRRCDRLEKVETRRKRVLVVDDSITVREVERQLLRNAGFEVDIAVDGRDGWNQARVGQYDLIVTDIDMPRMTGLELLRAIREHDPIHDVPIIIVSYKDRDEDRRRGLELGANFYLTKSSFHDNTFLRAVADLIGEA